MANYNGIRFDWRAIDDLPFAYIAISTAVNIIIVWILTRGRLLVLSPTLMRYEFLRFLTLLRYPRQNKPDLVSIAVAGFYYDGNTDSITCYMCGLTIYGITRNDNPLQLHIEKSRSCAFFLRNQESNFRCFNGTHYENHLFQRPNNGEIVTLEHLNNIHGNAIETVSENEEDREDNESIGSSDAFDPSVEGDFDLVNVENEMPSLPYAVGVHEGHRLELPMEHHREHIQGNYDVESDLSVRLNSYRIQTINEQEAPSERYNNHQDEGGFQPEPGSSDTVEVSANNSLHVRDGENVVYHCNEREYNSPVSLASHTENEQQDNLIIAGNTCTEEQYFSPSSGANLGHNRSCNTTYNNTSEIFNRVSPIITLSSLPGIMRQHYQIDDPSLQYSSNYRRLQSFQEWPNEHIVKAMDLAAAGFSYTGIEDCVRCFQCKLELSQWEHGDDPWFEHAKNRSNCRYVQQFLRPNFVRGLTEIHNNEEEIDKYKACLEFPSRSNEEVSVRNDLSERVPSSARRIRTDETICKICRENLICCAFIPCGHMACRTCADVDVCPICQKDIQGHT